MNRPANSVVVFDFETTGLSPDQGDRAIEIGAVLLENGDIAGHYSALMNPGFRVSAFIESYTGISNEMLTEARSCEAVMAEFAEFLGDHNMVAHNASFDRRFLEAELRRIDRCISGRIACSMLLARRLVPTSPDHKLGTLVRHLDLPTDGVFHRALADAEMTAHLWLDMLGVLHREHDVRAPTFALMQEIARKPKHRIKNFLDKVLCQGPGTLMVR